MQLTTHTIKSRVQVRIHIPCSCTSLVLKSHCSTEGTDSWVTALPCVVSVTCFVLGACGRVNVQ